MVLKEAFYKTLSLLETYYSNHKQDGAVISILSDLDCTIFRDGKPADEATYDDWEEVIRPLIKNEKISDSDVKKALIKFLVHYQEAFGYELENAIEYFRNI